MAANRIFRFGPIALTATLGTNLLNPATTTGGVNAPGTATYILLKHIRIVNKTAGAVTFSLFIGATAATAAGTEFMGNGLSVPANSFIEWYGQLRLDTADFLVGGAGALTSLTIQGEGEVGVAG